MNPSGALSASSSPCVFPYFTYLELILVAVTFFWYGQEKHPQPQLLSIETRAATYQQPQHKVPQWPLVCRTSRAKIMHKMHFSLMAILGLTCACAHTKSLKG